MFCSHDREPSREARLGHASVRARPEDKAVPRARVVLLLITGAALLGAALPGRVRAEDPVARGLTIAQAADKANEGFMGERATMAMVLVNAHGDVTRRKLNVVTQEGTTDGDRSKVVFEWPADVKGTKLLTWTHKAGGDDQWLYLPAIKRVRRISASNKTGSFVGSEFSYEDLAGTEVEKFRYKLIDEPKLDGRDTYRLERVPVDASSGYARQIVWLDKQYQNPLRIEYHDRAGTLLKVATLEGYKQFGRLWRAGSITMENVQTKKRSVLSWENRQLGIKLPASELDSARLED
jgi:hypothetical protein